MNNSNDALQIGLTSIERNDYHLFKPDCRARYGSYVVIDNNTGLRGLLSEDNKEILPCIFDDIDVTMSGFVEVHFKGSYFEFMILSKDYKPKSRSERYDFNGGIWYYSFEPNEEYRDEKTGKVGARVRLDETTQLLISLLSVRHA